jgi:transcriptional regulator with XRE-family HTH domain
MAMRVPGYNIRILREQMGLSLRALASSAGIDVAALSRLEAGTSDGRRSTIEKIAKSLAVSIEVLYSPPHMVEAAALRMRNVPVLRHEQIEKWLDGTLEMADDQAFLHADLRKTSRLAFALAVVDEANAPLFAKQDDLLFDPHRQPKPGNFVAAQRLDKEIIIGRFRPLPVRESEPCFEIVPIDPMRFAIASSQRDGLKLLGTLVESRRYF